MTTRTNARPRTALRLEVLEAREVPAGLGELDPTFGTGGVALTSLPSGNGFGQVSAAVDPFGRTVLVGSGGDGVDDGLLVGRLNPDGTTDTTFGNGGTVLLPSALPAFVSPGGVAVDAAGNIVVVGQSVRQAGGQFVALVARLTADGHFDPTFGPHGNGTVETELPPGMTGFRAGGLAIDAAGRVVLVGGLGQSGNADSLAVYRFTPGGDPDATFDGDGLRVVDSTGSLGHGSGVAFAPDGRIVVTATALFTSAVTVARLNPDGSTDLTFDGDGIVRPAGLIGPGCDVTVDPAGNVFLSGIVLGAHPVVVKLTAAGAPDATFGAGGTFEGPAELGQVAGEFDLAVLADGRVVAALNATPQGATFAVAHATVFLLTADGHLDPAFNAGGPTPGVTVFYFDSTKFTRITDLDVTPTGDVVVGGFYGLSGFMAAARLGGAGGGRVEPYGGVGVGVPEFVVEPVPEPPLSPEPVTGLSGRSVRADLNADGVLDTITVTGPGTPIRVTAVSGKDNTAVLIPPFDPFGGDFTGGGFVTAADLDGDGWSEVVVTPDQGGGARVVVFSLVQAIIQSFPESQRRVWVRASFLGIDDPNFRGGARAAVGDVNGDGVPDLAVSAGFLGGPRVALFDGTTLLGGTPTRLVNDFFAFPGSDAETLRNGAHLALGDVDGDGKADLILGGGAGGAPRVFVLSGAKLAAGDVASAQASPIANFFVGGDETARGGVWVGVRDADDDGRADVVVASSDRVGVYFGKEFGGNGEPTGFEELDPSDELVG